MQNQDGRGINCDLMQDDVPGFFKAVRRTFKKSFRARAKRGMERFLAALQRSNESLKREQKEG